MLVIKSKFPKATYVYGGGLFDVVRNLYQKTTSPGKLIGSKNLDKALDSELGKEITDSILTGVNQATKNITKYNPRKRKRPSQTLNTKRRKGEGFEEGSGVFDIAKSIFQKTANTSLGKKLVSSATKENLKKAANSALGQEVKNSLLAGVTEATKNIVTDSAERIGLPVSNKKRKRKNSVSKAKKKKGNGIIWE